MSQHTPRPWVAEIVINPQTRIAYPWAIWKDGVRLARVDSRPMAVRDEEEANARLIAKAPEMVHLLKTVADLWVGDPNHPLRNEIRALLREIEGERP